ncbi:CocE/NonD family hydrolase [Altericroceibacterium xinjiangense]|uniref:CocE/NonD family hydrolase n=1 Tax=Altericroceibacterium xinjiangense TaxID=762261 RepID=UPI001F49A225|nr:CocE/NonD family hydrolase [Altericroceibacterium xinjiangense]
MGFRILIALAALLSLAPIARAQDFPAVERQSLYVPVRDGTRLAVNIYRPADENGAVQKQLPVIFVFTPYRARFVNAEGEIEEAALSDRLALRSLIKAGYVVAVADIRGKGASFGSRRGFQDRTEAQDGYDLVEWLADQPFSSGAVGMVGCSYLGGTTMHTASTAPPSLRAIFTGATDWDKYEFVRRGGITAQFNTRPDEPLSDDLASVPVDADEDGALLREAVAQHAVNTPMAGLWYSMPYRDSVSPLTGNAFWEEVAIWRYADAIRKAGIATYLWSNWKDEPTGQVIVAAENLGSRLLIGPGSHCVPPPGFDFTGEIRRFFDFHLKGIANGLEEQPRVTYWSDEGEGGYVRTDSLPGADARTVAYYLSADEGEDLALAARPGPNASDAFTVDYDVSSNEYFAFWPGPLDEHGVVYTSAPLDHPIDLLGYPVAHLEIAADRDDADVFVYLEQVAPGGKVDVLSFGRLKISHRSTSEAPWDNLGLPWHSGNKADVAPLAVGETARLSIAMMPLSHRFEPGSRLRFVVTGADPRQRNLADVRQDPAPRLTIVRGWDAGSRIDLPVRPAGSRAGADGASGSSGTVGRKIGEPAGSGPYPAVAQARDDTPGYTFYRPQVLPRDPLPLVLWGNGGCRDNGLSASHALRELASHGFLVIANGAPREEQPIAGALQPSAMPGALPSPAERRPDETTVAQFLAAIDWAESANADPADPLYGRIDTSRLAVMGHSCGGLQALAAGADPRVDTVVVYGSGVYNRPGTGLSGVQVSKDDLGKLHTPIAYILGGPSDIAYPNGTDDFRRIDHVPVMLANLPVGHGGTFASVNGGEWARAGAQWLRWQLNRDEDAAREFVGPECRLCTRDGWSVERKQFPEAR